MKYDFPTAGKSKPESVIAGGNYRITVLTPSLLRLEYSESGEFEDRPTQSVINRDFTVVPFTVKKGKALTIETEKLLLTYDEKPFSGEGLSIRVKEIEGAVWKYGQELHDLRGTYRTLDFTDGTHYKHRNDPEREIELGHGVLSREGFSLIDDSGSLAINDGWVTPRVKETDLYFFGYGHRYLEALRDFYKLCGKTPLLPRYALGNWWSRYYRYTEATYKELMNRFEAEKLPFTVAVIDMDWHLVDDVDPKYGDRKPGWTGYTWNRKFFPDPEGFMKWLHDKGLKITLNVHPADGVRDYEEIYPEMAKAMGIDPASEQTVKFDPADPKFMDAYFNVLSHSLEKQGVDFWWIDWQQGTASKLEGLDPLWSLNHFHFLDSSWKGTRRLTFSRYAGVGSHRYPVGFSGDTSVTWASLDYQPYFTSTASNIGYGWWSHDIGGHYLGARDDELTARWVQFGVFSPINRLHSSNNPFMGKEPWRFGDATRDVMNEFLRLRHAMIPYLYSMNRRASREDRPIVEPLYYAEPERAEAYEVPNEYYFGTELLVSPITTPMDPVSLTSSAKTWLPAGLWADFFTGTVYEGGRMVDLRRPIHEMPVLMKSGAILPLTDDASCSNTVKNPTSLEVRVFPAADGNFTLWEDAGDTPEDLDKNWASTDLAWKSNTFIVSPAKGNTAVLPGKRSWKIVFCSVENSDAIVLVDGKPIKAETTYDEDKRRLTVLVPETAVGSEIAISFAAPLTIADNRKQRIYNVLERAQMNYTLKEDLWNAILDKDSIEGVTLADGTKPAESIQAALEELL
ncbi:MAG: DUF5110 domain-containing protein [Clostridia bacterium]|nr:DUF5110 domain-containing protein [Clostridia bacterium]